MNTENIEFESTEKLEVIDGIYHGEIIKDTRI